MDCIEIRDVTKTFGAFTAVDDLSLGVPAGSVYGFIGPNGSGKTTTLRMIMNIFYPDRGRIRVFGEELRGASTDRIGYLPEERGLYKRMKVRELLRFYGDLKGGRDLGREVRRVVAALAAGGGLTVADTAAVGLRWSRRELRVGRFHDPGTKITTAV